ncbi:hypothetical protein [Francisella-like endosymbiont]|uniref:hypothetical protein n=1 Tax=Francisella-like endosymbiont TaxID=512373 RepID=UPI00117B7D98
MVNIKVENLILIIDDYCVTHEAFCQVLNEVPLDITTDTKEFLAQAIAFYNTKFLGILGSYIIID